MVPRNPYRTALLVTSLVAFGLAGVVWLIGTATVNNAYSPDGIAAAAGFFAFASSLVGLGVLALLLWLVVSSLTWRAPAAPEATAPAKAAKPRPASAGPRTELDRVREALDDEDQG